MSNKRKGGAAPLILTLLCGSARRAGSYRRCMPWAAVERSENARGGPQKAQRTATPMTAATTSQMSLLNTFPPQAIWRFVRAKWAYSASSSLM